jgi:hypothetical protein
LASHELIDAYRASLGRRLPAETVDELVDGLHESWHHHCATGLPPAEAARAAVTEFGTVEQVVRAFVINAPGRRTARLLLATGPLVGVCWGAGLGAAHAWDWPVPTGAAVGFAAALIAVAGTLLIAATGTGSLRRTRLGVVGGLGLVVLDLTMIAAVLLVAPAMSWPMYAAIPASLGRIAFAVCSIPAIRGR